MKKVLAIILSIAMLFGVLAINTFAEGEDPTVTIITNEGSAVDKGVTTYFTVRFDNFSSIKGIDVTITADQYITLGDVQVAGFENTKAELGVNYTESNEGDEHTIRFVDLTGSKSSGRIIFEATVPETAQPTDDPSIKVEGKYADSGKTFCDIDAPVNGTFELTKEIATDNVETEQKITAAENKFIPAGGVYTGSGADAVFIDKNDDGSFNAPAGAVYQTFDIPENKITTFAAADDPKNSAKLRFGNYSQLDGNHGTLVFDGEWLVLKNHYIKKGYTVQQFVEAIYNAYETTLAKNPDATYVYYNVEGERINVYKFPQQKYMWKDEVNGILEYAVNLLGTTEGKTYTAVAYCEKDGKATISEQVKSVTK